MKIWSELHDENILSLLGYTVHEEGNMIFVSLVSKWMRNGTVLEFVRKEHEKADILYLVRTTVYY